MSHDETNTGRDVDFAVNAMRASLDVAIQAMAWRETSTGRSLDSCRAVSFRNRRHRCRSRSRTYSAGVITRTPVSFAVVRSGSPLTSISAPASRHS